jgi:DNA-binding MarR family transcriptional regulator
MDATATHRRFDDWVFAWCSLMQRSRRWQSCLDEALQPQALSAAEFLVLWRTGHAAAPGISQVELARELNVSAAHICGLVERLQGRGWLHTVRAAGDRRRLYCSLTSAGNAALQRLIADLLPVADRCLREDSPGWSDAQHSRPYQEEAA